MELGRAGLGLGMLFSQGAGAPHSRDSGAMQRAGVPPLGFWGDEHQWGPTSPVGGRKAPSWLLGIFAFSVLSPRDRHRPINPPPAHLDTQDLRSGPTMLQIRATFSSSFVPRNFQPASALRRLTSASGGIRDCEKVI